MHHVSKPPRTECRRQPLLSAAYALPVSTPLPTSPTHQCSASEEEWSDDEDVSWKVRRAAAKAVSAVITHFPDLLPEVSHWVLPVVSC